MKLMVDGLYSEQELIDNVFYIYLYKEHPFHYHRRIQEEDASLFAIFMKGQAITAKLKVDCAIRVRWIQSTAKKLGIHILLFYCHSNLLFVSG
jgi:hypothetical protein